jgi:hypothetical protein
MNVGRGGPSFVKRATAAVPELLYPESTILERHFPQENAALNDLGQGAGTLEPL